MPVGQSNSVSPDRGLESAITPPSTPPERLVWLAKATSVTERCLRRRIQQHAKVVQLNEAELLVLWTMARTDACGVAQNHLVSEIGLSAAQVSNLLDGLRRDGLVASQRQESDRRRQTWRLETSGQQRLAAALTEMACLAEAIFQQLSPEDQTLLESLLSRLRKAAEAPNQLLRVDGRVSNSSTPEATRQQREAA